MYSELRPDRIVETIESLQKRIEESFPESGLGQVAAELGKLARDAGPTAGWLRKPMWLLRIGAGLGVSAIAALMLVCAAMVNKVPLRIDGLGELLQASEAAANDLILLSLVVFFLFSLETRVKRTRALAALHRLRSIVHIVDMHQLTKDPQHLLSPGTAFPPKRTFTRLELARYLDFCSELLSLASKLAALHVQYLNDPVVLAAVNDVEALSGSLSSKIWQKIMILDVMVPSGPRLCASTEGETCGSTAGERRTVRRVAPSIRRSRSRQAPAVGRRAPLERYRPSERSRHSDIALEGGAECASF